ncbi:MAG: polyprenyl synthetase family protein [Lachnospiraceae bacterium]|nr:polyprenyl synthetase family protein [Lachnospiraceae bacterium]
MNKERLNRMTQDIEAGFKPYLPEETGFQKTVLEAVNYSLGAGGKRLRPMFMQQMYRLCGGSDEKAIRPFMMAMEMIHTYSLVHDDLPAMDNDDLRRGKPTTHKQYGEAMGILAGDALLNGAFETAFLAFDSQTEPACIGRALKILGNKAGMYGMVGGQVVDVENNGQFVEEETLRFVYEKKTAALIEASFMIGVVLAGGSEEDIRQAEKMGTALGIAFQIQDDILDVVGQEDVLGKPVHSDEKNEKSTYVALHGLEKSRAKVKEYTDAALALLDSFGEDTGEEKNFLRDLMFSLIERKK